MRWWAKPAVIVVLAMLFAVTWLAWEAWNLPGTNEIRGHLFLHYTPKGQATWVPLWAISANLQTAVVVREDPSFFHHAGLNFLEIARATLINLRAGSYQRGASTITQQVAKNLFLGPEKTLHRKVREAVLARRLERALSKDEILTLYLNIAEWGDGIVGAEEASRRYFDKSAADLDWAEAALLAGILPNPRQLNTCKDPARANQARHAVLTKLLSSQSLSQQEFEDADAAPCCGCHDFAAPATAAGKR